MIEIAQVLLTLILASPVATVSVAVDTAADRHPISPLIYGVSFADFSAPNAPPYPVHRWGGNATTRYSWEDDGGGNYCPAAPNTRGQMAVFLVRTFGL